MFTMYAVEEESHIRRDPSRLILKEHGSTEKGPLASLPPFFERNRGRSEVCGARGEDAVVSKILGRTGGRATSDEGMVGDQKMRAKAELALTRRHETVGNEGS